MKLQKEFIVARPRAKVVADLDDDRTLAKLFPDTRVEHTVDGARETLTPYTTLGQNREIRFVFQTLPDGNLHFEKVCDGNVWRSLRGDLRLEAIDERMTRVVLSMDGQTRAFVPEITIRVPMREQIDQMAKALRAQLERD